MECDEITNYNIKNKFEIIEILQNQTYIGLHEIRILAGCSDRMARVLREKCLHTYLFGNASGDMQMQTLKGLKTKVRLDKFLEFYDNKLLTGLYKSIWNIGFGETE